MTDQVPSEKPSITVINMSPTTVDSQRESANGSNSQIDFFEEIREFVSSRSNQTTTQTTKDKLLEAVDLLKKQTEEKALSPELVLEEIKNFSRTFSSEQPLDNGTRNTICNLVQKVIETDFDSTKLDNETAAQDLKAIRSFIQAAENRSRELGLERIAQAVEEETAGLIALLYRIERLAYKEKIKPPKVRELKVLAESLDTARESLFQGKPNIKLARKIRIDTERFVCRYEYPNFGVWLSVNRFKDAYRSESTTLKVLVGLIAAFSINVILISGVSLVGFCAYLVYTSYGTSNQSIEDLETEVNNNKIDLETTKKKLGEVTQEYKELKNPPINAQSSNPPAPINKVVVTEELKRLAKEIEDQKSEVEQQKNEVEKKQGELRKSQTKLNITRSRQEKLIGLGGLRQFIWVMVAGTLGSIVSILIRIEDFQDKKYLDPATPFLIGGFKPLIGAAFAVFFFSLINSKLIVIPSVDYAVLPSSTSNPGQPTSTGAKQLFMSERNDSAREFFIFAIAFLVGFSERLGKDTISKLENTISGESESKSQDKPSNK